MQKSLLQWNTSQPLWDLILKSFLVWTPESDLKTETGEGRRIWIKMHGLVLHHWNQCQVKTDKVMHFWHSQPGEFIAKKITKAKGVAGFWKEPDKLSWFRFRRPAHLKQPAWRHLCQAPCYCEGKAYMCWGKRMAESLTAVYILFHSV